MTVREGAGSVLYYQKARQIHKKSKPRNLNIFALSCVKYYEDELTSFPRGANEKVAKYYTSIFREGQ